jgi:hypothetical protein
VFNFRMAEGERTLNRAAASRGQYFSGAALSKLADFSLALTGEETDKYISRRVTALNSAVTGLTAELGEQAQSVNQGLSLATLGLNAVQGQAGATTGTTQLQSQLAGSAAQTIGQTELAKGAALSQGLGGISSTVGGLATLAFLTRPKTDNVSSAVPASPSGLQAY